MKKLLLMALILFSCFIVTEVNADIGPKPSIEVIVEGLDEEYYMDLLSPETSFKDDMEYYNSLSTDMKEAVEPLMNYVDEDGFKLHMLNDLTPVPVGNILSEKQSNGSYRNYYSYMVPDEFKIIILRSNGDILVSDIITTTQFNTLVKIDLSEVSFVHIEGDEFVYSIDDVRVVVPFGDSIAGFISRVALTVIIEIAIGYFFFGFKTRRIVRAIILINIITQVILNVVVFNTYNPLIFFIMMVAIEPLIILAEGLFYSTVIKNEKKWKLWMFALLANVVTALLTFVL